MDVKGLCQNLGLNSVAGQKGMDREVNGAYAGDLLSFVMANAARGNVWVTIQAHSNIVAVASLLEMACIIVAADVKVDGDTLERANGEGIPILTAKDDTYTLCCKLHDLGV
jgi:predicted transcriptional regulator